MYLPEELRAQEDLDHENGNHIVPLEFISDIHDSMLKAWSWFSIQPQAGSLLNFTLSLMTLFQPSPT